MMKMKCLNAVAAIWLLAVMATSAHAQVKEYSAGHGDIGLAFHDEGNGPELELHWHFDGSGILDGARADTLTGFDPDDGIEFEPDEIAILVTDANKMVLGQAYSWLGNVASDEIWILPQSNVPGRPFLSLAGEELSNATFSDASLFLIDVTGPGNFAAGQFNGFTPEPIWVSNNGFGIDDEINIGVGDGAHDHFFYAFTQPGIYDIELTGEADLIAGGSETDTGTFRFVVGNVTAIPEPSSWAVLAAVTGGLVCFRRRKRASTLAS
jgi:surface-anchored protein